MVCGVGGVVSGHVSPSRKVNLPSVPIYYGVSASEPGESEDEVFGSKMKEVEPASFFFVSDSESEFGAKAYHSFFVGGSVGIVGDNGRRKSFFRPVIFCYEVVVDEVSRCSRI